MVVGRQPISHDVEFLDTPGETVLEVTADLVVILALEATLLLEGLIDAVRVRSPERRLLTIRNSGEHRVSKASVQRRADGCVEFVVGQNQLEYMRAVLLRAYRDDAAETGHIHVEGECKGQPHDLTLMFTRHLEPMSAEDAKRMMSD